jgi:HSP90 family molecular chaperone
MDENQAYIYIIYMHSKAKSEQDDVVDANQAYGINIIIPTDPKGTHLPQRNSYDYVPLP